VGWAGYAAGEMRNIYELSEKKTEGNKLLTET
jgi:hypothetical protein